MEETYSYRYETHLHTSPASKCARQTPREALENYKALGYAGVFITNHFLDGNIGCDKTLPYKEQLDFYLADYYEAKKLEKEIGISVFFGVELSYKGTDFLIWGLEPEWYYEHPEIMEMRKSEELPFLREAGALVVHAHPFRDSSYIDHIRLFPKCVEGVEVINGHRTPLENTSANWYADTYRLVKTAGSDNHKTESQPYLAGVSTQTPLENERDFIERIRQGKTRIFTCSNPYYRP